MCSEIHLKSVPPKHIALSFESSLTETSGLVELSGKLRQTCIRGSKLQKEGPSWADIKRPINEFCSNFPYRAIRKSLKSDNSLKRS